MKVFWLRTKIDKLKKQLEALRAKDAEFETREKELRDAIEDAAQAEGEDAAEKQEIIEEEVEKFDAEKKQHEEDKAKLEGEIEGLEEELKKEEEAQDTTPAEVPAQEPTKEENRGGKTIMSTRTKIFGEKIRSIFNEAGDAINESVKNWLGEVRACIKEKRELTGVGLTIPEVFLGVLRENMINYSKLYKYLDVRPLAGNGRLVVQGKISEAIWTECCANINELTLGFSDVEVNCYKVAGFYQVCNATLEDSDADLSAIILEAIGQSIGLAVDKAVLYGRNSNKTQKMPLGIVTRLAQTSEPADYPATARPWVDLHTSNIKSLTAGLTGAALFKAIALASGAMKGDYSRGAKVWLMNETTHTKIMAESMVSTADGRFVQSADSVMPGVGGTIEVLNFIPDNTIIAGFFDLYLLAERAGQKFAQSEHVRFLEDATVFKGTARYDGQPTIAEAFVAIGLEGTTPAANSVTFAPDEANVVKGIILSNTTATLDISDGDTLQLVAETYPVKGAVTFTSSDETKATVTAAGLVEPVASGTAVITAVSGSASATCTVTVTA